MSYYVGFYNKEANDLAQHASVYKKVETLPSMNQLQPSLHLPGEEFFLQLCTIDLEHD